MPGVQRTFYSSHFIWLSLLALFLIYLFSSLRVVSDITQFMPDDHRDKNVQLLLNELQQGSTARLLIVSIKGADTEKLADISRELKTKLTNTNAYSLVHNGQQTLSSNEFISGQYKELYQYRYLLSKNSALSKQELTSSLQQRLSELRAGINFFKETLSTDPQNHFLEYLLKLTQRANTTTHHGVWFDKHKTSALLLVELNLKQFDLDKQQYLIEEINETISDISNKHALNNKLQVDITGSASIAIKTRSAIQSTSKWLSGIALTLMFILFWWSYRSLHLFIIAMLPLATAIICALAVTNFLFNQVHGIIIAFGITLLGVCLDYPAHLFSHHAKDKNPQHTILSIWPTLRLGVITTALAYLAMLGTGFSGLSQLSIFAISGLITALFVTRWIIPYWLTSNDIQPNHSYLITLSRIQFSAKQKVYSGILVIVACSLMLSYNYNSIWSKDISDLSPVPEQAKKLDKTLRHAVAAPDVNHVFMLKNNNSELLLQQTEELKGKLQSLQERGIVKNIYAVTDFIPSKKIQILNQKQLPQRKILRSNLTAAASDLPFKTDFFNPFIDDVIKSKTLEPLDIETVLAMPLGKQLQQDLFFRNNEWVSIVRLSGIKNDVALQQWLENRTDILPYYLNLKQATSALMSDYQKTALFRLLLGAMIIFIILLIFRPKIRAVFILAPVLLAVLLSISIQVLLGTSLTLFHTLALLLIIGIGLDYSLFFDRKWVSNKDYLQRLHGIFIGATSTLITFGILSFSDIPVLSALGQTVSIGVLACFVLTFIFSKSNRNKSEYNI